MIGATVGQIALALYALWLASYGLVGYVKQGNRLSLIEGSSSAIVAASALMLSLAYSPWGFRLGVFLSFAGNTSACACETTRESCWERRYKTSSSWSSADWSCAFWVPRCQAE